MKKISGELALDYCEKFPGCPSKTLALKAYKENPGVWLRPEAARSAIRTARGNNGKTHRKNSITKDFMRPSGHQSDTFKAIPEGWRAFQTWESVQIGCGLRALILPDVHVPFHSAASLEAALKCGAEYGCDTIILNGDFMDFHAVSRWEQDPRKRKFADEIKIGVEILGIIRQRFPKARIIYKDGNHEERWERYFWVKAPELLDLEKFQMESVLEFKRLGIERIADKKPYRLGKLYGIHGHEYKFAISNPVNAARGLFLRAKISAFCSHFHQKSEHQAKALDDKIISTWSTGCLCELHPDYMPLNEHSNGFMVVEVDNSGRFNVHNKKIIDGKVF